MSINMGHNVGANGQYPGQHSPPMVTIGSGPGSRETLSGQKRDHNDDHPVSVITPVTIDVTSLYTNIYVSKRECSGHT